MIQRVPHRRRSRRRRRRQQGQRKINNINNSNNDQNINKRLCIEFLSFVSLLLVRRRRNLSKCRSGSLFFVLFLFDWPQSPSSVLCVSVCGLFFGGAFQRRSDEFPAGGGGSAGGGVAFRSAPERPERPSRSASTKMRSLTSEPSDFA